MHCVYVKILAIAAVLSVCSGSAIPMFEYLTRSEKMSHLYSMFAKQVQVYCKTANNNGMSIAECKRDLMTHGLSKLNDMSESHLDIMDPYQRGAMDILWDSMMDGHPSNVNENEKTQHLTDEQQKFQNPQLFKDDTEGSSSYNNPSREVVETGAADSSTMIDMDDSMDHYNNYMHESAATNTNYNYAQFIPPTTKDTNLNNAEHLEQNTNYLLGPMVTMVRLDGTPINMKQQIPVDDDRDDLMMGRDKMTSMKNIYDRVATFDENAKVIVLMPPSSSSSQNKKLSSMESIGETTVYPTADSMSSYTTGARNLYVNYRINDRSRDFN